MPNSQGRAEFEDAIRGAFKFPEEAFLSRKPGGYYNGHLNAYYQVWNICKSRQDARVENLKNNLWDIIANSLARKKGNAPPVALAKQICIDIRAYLDDLS